MLLFYNVIIIGNPPELRSIIKHESNLLALLAKLWSCKLEACSISNAEDPHVPCITTLPVVVWDFDGYGHSIQRGLNTSYFNINVLAELFPGQMIPIFVINTHMTGLFTIVTCSNGHSQGALIRCRQAQIRWYGGGCAAGIPSYLESQTAHKRRKRLGGSSIQGLRCFMCFTDFTLFYHYFYFVLILL